MSKEQLDRAINALLNVLERLEQEAPTLAYYETMAKVAEALASIVDASGGIR